ncbi:flagellar biosynthetic protein FliO [Gammaproteobacteria bacterium LSUCC0112]|nr:flagellar biosynthetic protein FliO [Gammaproteobacteria bacterium LSUCC0112]
MTELTTASDSLEPVSIIGAGGANALGQTLLWLVVVVGLILLLAWLAKRLGGLQLQNAGAIKVLSMMPVGNKERIALVQVGDKQILIGIAPGRVNTLHVFEHAVINTEQAEDAGISVSGKQSFQQILINTVTGKRS